MKCIFHGDDCWLNQADASLDLRKVEIKEVEERLSQMVKDVEKAVDSEEFKNMIAVWRQFHHYSVYNMLMILTQKRTATRVAGFRSWRKFGRYVKKGEKGIMILCPRWAKRKVVEEDPDTGEETEVEQEHIYFVPGYVFDVTQTEGKDLPEVETLPQGQDVAEYYPMLREYVENKLNLGVREATIPQMGYTTKDEIVINSKYRGLEKVAVIVHEIAHQLFEHLIKYTDKTRKMKELEAESTVYVVNSILGIPTMGATFYIAAWTKTPREIMGSLNRMHTVVQEILDIMAKPEGEQFPACPVGGEVSARSQRVELREDFEGRMEGTLPVLRLYVNGEEMAYAEIMPNRDKRGDLLITRMHSWEEGKGYGTMLLRKVEDYATGKQWEFISMITEHAAMPRVLEKVGGWEKVSNLLWRKTLIDARRVPKGHPSLLEARKNILRRMGVVFEYYPPPPDGKCRWICLECDPAKYFTNFPAFEKHIRKHGHSFGRMEPKNARSPSERLPHPLNIYTGFYTQIEKLTGDLPTFLREMKHIKLKSKGFMDLVIESIGNNRISMAHYYEQEHDLMSDPEMEIEVNVEQKVAEPLTYTQSSLGIYNEVYRYDDHGNKTHIDTKMKTQLRNFLRKWLQNIKIQQFTGSLGNPTMDPSPYEKMEEGVLRTRVVHKVDEKKPKFTLCGKVVWRPVTTTRDPQKVTCKTCQSIMNFRLESGSKRKAKFTPEEEKAWEYAFAFYINEGLSEEDADEAAWKDVQDQFLRLKRYTGVLPRRSGTSSSF